MASVIRHSAGQTLALCPSACPRVLYFRQWCTNSSSTSTKGDPWDMELDFGRSSHKLKREQEKRRIEAQRRLERERKVQQEAKRQQALVQEGIQQKRLEQARREEEARRRAEDELRLTAGITFEQELLPYDVSGEGDRVVLPKSVLEALTQQDALAQGVILLRLTLPDGRRTHAGVLEFSAEEGTVGLPLRVRRSLGEVDVEGKLEKITIKYVRLEKGKYVKMQPKTAGLSQVPEVRATLEHNLQRHATLSVGDLVQVYHRGRCFDIRVVELQPADAVTVIDTDLTVDLDIPEEQARQEDEAARQEASKRLRGSPARAVGLGKDLGEEGHAEQGRGHVSPAGLVDRRGEKHESDSEDEETQAETWSDAVLRMLSVLPPEPLAGEEGTIQVMVRKPDGGQVGRNFWEADAVKYLFTFVDCGLPAPAAYRLVGRYPRRLISREEGEKRLADVGLKRQEVLLFEPI